MLNMVTCARTREKACKASDAAVDGKARLMLHAAYIAEIVKGGLRRGIVRVEPVGVGNELVLLEQALILAGLRVELGPHADLRDGGVVGGANPR